MTKLKDPTLEEVEAYFLERGTNIDPETFHAHYEAVDWHRGKTKIKNWKACLVTWEKRDPLKNKSLKQMDDAMGAESKFFNKHTDTTWSH